MAERVSPRTKASPASSASALKNVPLATVQEQVNRLRDLIAHRAFDRFQIRGWSSPDAELDDWFTAERELLHPLHLEITETDRRITARAELNGFTAHDLQIGAEPRRVIIVGQRKEGEKTQAPKAKLAAPFFRQIFCVLDLPAEIDPAKAKATLKSGILELQMTKAAGAKPARRRK